ncbi:MAG: hypothetical protein VCC19_02445 [Myxococcota bacterium]
MRHRRREGAGDQNVDSLLDTMANVVGILIVLMAVTQLTVNDAMKRIRMWEREEATSLREATQDARTQLAGIGESTSCAPSSSPGCASPSASCTRSPKR